MQACDVAAYIWPAYTGDEPRARIFWPAGMGEWETVLAAGPKFAGHSWPRRPLWGYGNEADPRVMEMQIDAAAEHGVNVFIYDWYWYDGRPFLENCLNDGYLKARNNHRVQFYLMWANHHATDVWDRRLARGDSSTVVWDGRVCRAEFERLAARLVRRYFQLPSYYRIEGRPVFQIYDLANFIEGLGGLDAAKDALNWLRQEAVRAGLPGVHLLATLWGAHVLDLSGVDGSDKASLESTVARLPFDGATHYQFVHFADISRPYPDLLPAVRAEWERLGSRLPFPYHPHVSLGWDNNPRYKERRHDILAGNTPAAVRDALHAAREYAARHPAAAPLVTVNSWNEWTESSYLQPDDVNGYAYLEAVREVFGPAQGTGGAGTGSTHPNGGTPWNCT